MAINLAGRNVRYVQTVDSGDSGDTWSAGTWDLWFTMYGE